MTRSQRVCCRHGSRFWRRRLRFLRSLRCALRYGVCAWERAWKVEGPAQVGRRRGLQRRRICGQVLKARAQRRHRLDGRLVRGLVVVGHGGRDDDDGSMAALVLAFDKGGRLWYGREYAPSTSWTRQLGAQAERIRWMQEVCASRDGQVQKARKVSRESRTVGGEDEEVVYRYVE